MPYPVPTPAAITARAAAVYAGIYSDFNASEANTVAGANCRIVGMTGYDLYQHQLYLAQELFPDTTQDNLDRWAAIWGLTRIPPMAATGTASAAGANATPIPAGTLATDPLGSAYLTTASAAIAGTTATVAISAVSAGAQGNLAPGTVITLLSPIAGLAPQSFTVLAPGLSGGGPAESNDALRARLLQRIRQRGRGGNTNDYTQWAEASSSAVADVQVIPVWLGPGSVGVFVSGIGPTALTTAEVATVAAFIGGQTNPAGAAPVTAYVVVRSATVVPLNATVHLVPDTAANRLAAATAFAVWVGTSATIGGTLFAAGMDAAINGALGGGSFDRIAPAGDVVGVAGTIAAAGTLSFV